MAFWKKKKEEQEKETIKKEINYVQRTGKKKTDDADGRMH